MMFIKGAEPKIFITCGIRRERFVCEDVMNILFGLGVEVGCRSYDGKGFAVVYLGEGVDVLRVVKMLVSRYVRGFWVIPIDVVCRSRYEDISRCSIGIVLLKGVRLPLRLIGFCRKRGNEVDSCSNLLRYVGEKLEDLGIAVVDFEDYTHVLRIEVVYENTFISLYERELEKLFRVSRA